VGIHKWRQVLFFFSPKIKYLRERKGRGLRAKGERESQADSTPSTSRCRAPSHNHKITT